MLSAKTVFEEILDNDEASRLFCSEVGGERAVLAWHGPNHSHRRSNCRLGRPTTPASLVTGPRWCCCAADDGRLEIAASAAAAAGSHNHRDQVTAAHLDGH
jgi:hypothetical protein